MIDKLKYLSNEEIKELKLDNLDEKTSSYIQDRFTGNIRRNCKPEYLPIIEESYCNMTDDELLNFFKIYDICEYVITEEEMDYIMSRIGNTLVYRPKYVEY